MDDFPVSASTWSVHGVRSVRTGNCNDRNGCLGEHWEVDQCFGGGNPSMCQTVGIGCLAGPKKSARVWVVEIQPMCETRGSGRLAGPEKPVRVELL